ncbi:hypothetical protein C923_04529 [Plasmodium falciparum UGT5.1]|uniref:Uncharacterized protein n=1 Tax=Plasmodium falciparum UGT5.1 TaxID=1237627 RepID=W7JIY4_PLAFA|nr:hypothetical protein C923_04529 [Plasmodium falciparum UGT5.1]
MIYNKCMVYYLIGVYFFVNVLKVYSTFINYNECDFTFDAPKLSDVYDKYNGVKDIEESARYSNYCESLESFNSVKSFWSLKLKSLCTEKTSILDKHVFNNICSHKFETPHIRINGLSVGKELVNIEFVCAHFLYSNKREIIKCIKSNSVNNYLDTYHIAFDLSVSEDLLKHSNDVPILLNLKDINGLSLTKKIIDDSVCRIHSSVHTIMNKYDYSLLKVLSGLCTKLGFHNQFIITDNIHPLFNPFNKKIPYSLSSLNFNIQNTSIYYSNYEYLLYSIKLTDVEYILGSYISPSALTISHKNNSYVTWIGLNKDNSIYNKKFVELYNALNKVKYIERIVHCYSKYTSKYYEGTIKYFYKYLPENKKEVMQNNPNIFIYLINSVCANIPSVHKCVEKIISLDGIYDLYFKNFMINFIYYNLSCVYNCNPLNLGKIMNDEHIWDILVKYFSNYYLVKYKKTKSNKDILSASMNQITPNDEYYKHFDFDYIHSGKWRTELNLEDEEAILKPSDDVVEYEFYNYTFHSLDLGSYSFFILKSEIEEDNICKIASFIEYNGKKYVHSNKYIVDFFKKNNKRMLSHDTSNNNNNNNNNNDTTNGFNDNNIQSGEKNSNEHHDEEDNHHDDHFDAFNFFDDFLGDDKDQGGNFIDIFKNNNLFNKNKLLEHLYDEDDEDYDDDDHHHHRYHRFQDKDYVFDIEKFKIPTNVGDVYPLKEVYTLKELQEVYEIHPSFNDSDDEIRYQFLKSESFGKDIHFTVKDVPSKIKDYYKYYYEIKKRINKFDNKNDLNHYNTLKNNYKNDPNAFSKVDIKFACSKKGNWPIRNVSGRWISDVLCEAYFVPQLAYNHYYAEKKYKNKEMNNKDNKAIQNIFDINLYTLREHTRLIGIEFEDQEPYRCAISYLGDENKKTILPVSATYLINIAIGFCALHGFKTVWLADSAFDINTNIYLRYTSILEQGKTYYEQTNFEIYGQTRLVAQLEYIASGMNIDNNIITSGIYKNRYNLVSYPGVDLKFQLLMSKKVKNIIYNLKFDCHDWTYKGCSEYYPLMKKKMKKQNMNTTNNYNHIILNGNYSDNEKEKMYECAFMHDPMFIELNKMFPKECTYGSRIGECHKKIRKEIPCYNEKTCKYQKYIYEQFYKPHNNINLLNEHFIKVSEQLTRLSRPYYLQSIISLEHDIQMKKENGVNTDYDDIILFILKNSVFYVSWVTSSEYWKRAIHVQDSNLLLPPSYNENNTNNNNNKELFCPVAYSHEFIGHMLVQYMKFPNKT